jgi:hypothetical protein
MIRLLVAIALGWAVLLPPFFTDGACTAEFDNVARQIQENRPSLASFASAQEYWNAAHVSVQSISVPIHNTVCHFYRDSAVRVQLRYDDQGRLRQLQADMKPFKYFSIPWLGVTLYWAK